MSLFHQKKLQSIQEKMKALQEEQSKIEQALSTSLLKALKQKDALHLDMNTLVGGIFFVIHKIKTCDEECENWQKEGQAFFNKKAK